MIEFFVGSFWILFVLGLGLSGAIFVCGFARLCTGQDQAHLT